MLEDKHQQEPVPFDNTFHRQLADVRNSGLSQNHPDVDLLNQEHQRNLRRQRTLTVLDSLTKIPALGPEALTQPTTDPRLLEARPKKVENNRTGLPSFSEMIELVQTTSEAGQLTLCVVAFPELLKVRIGLGEDALMSMKLSLAGRLSHLVGSKSCIVGDYADNKLIVLMPAVTKAKAEALFTKVKIRLSEEYAYCNHARIRTHAQVGIACSEPGHNWQELIAKADLAIAPTSNSKTGRVSALSWLQGLFCAKKVR